MGFFASGFGSFCYVGPPRDVRVGSVSGLPGLDSGPLLEGSGIWA